MGGASLKSGSGTVYVSSMLENLRTFSELVVTGEPVALKPGFVVSLFLESPVVLD